jgi:hypothetical protein
MPPWCAIFSITSGLVKGKLAATCCARGCLTGRGCKGDYAELNYSLRIGLAFKICGDSSVAGGFYVVHGTFETADDYTFKPCKAFCEARSPLE